jgi:3-deoxy-manno-octulosonate cytidylyltransferase (CMP-KDO synthetase)
MKNTAIIIPTRLGAKRFPNKPLAEINGIPMVLHVLHRAKESKIKNIFVATPDDKICKIINENGGTAILTKDNHESGTDRIHEVYLKMLKDKIDLIINLQGDMPNIKPDSILKLERLMRKNNCNIGTLGASIEKKEEFNDPNVVKVEVNKALKNDDFLDAQDFFRIKKDSINKNTYHHIGIYAFTSVGLTQYVKLSRSKLEIDRNLEQMRAMENHLTIKVGLSNSTPLSVDTEQDLIKISKEMRK